MIFLRFLTFAMLIAVPVIFVSCDDEAEPELIDFHVQLMFWDENSRDFVAGMHGNLTVTSGNETIYEGHLTPPGFNKIELPDGKGVYHVKIEESGWDTYERDFTAEELAKPLEVRMYYTVDRGLVAWYKFSNNFEDASGNQLHGTKTGNPTPVADRNGIAKSAYEFNGINFVTIPSETLELNEYSYSVWVYIPPSDFPDQGVASSIFSIGDKTSGKDQAIRLCNKFGGNPISGWVASGYNTGAIPYTFVTTGNIPEVARWYHIVVVRLGGHLTLYVNNVKIGQELTSTSDALYENSVVANIGANCQGTFGFNGAIDELRIYDRSLNETEIGHLFYKP